MAELTIQEASRLSGVSIHTIRAWEKRHRAIAPSRTRSGHRFFTFESVDRLKLLRRMKEMGHPISETAALKDHDLQALISPPDAPILNAPIFDAPFWAALLRMDSDRIRKALHALELKLGAVRFVLDAGLPALAEVGRQVERGMLSIAHEHLFTIQLREHLISLHEKVRKSRRSNSRKSSLIVLTTPEGDVHELGILGARLLCSHFGFKTGFFGPNLPVNETVQIVKALKPRFLIVGTTSLPRNSCNLLPEDYVQEVARRTKEVIVLAGGNGLSPTWKPVGSRIQIFESLRQLSEFLEASK